MGRALEMGVGEMAACVAETQIQMHKYKYTNRNVQIQKYKNTNTKDDLYKLSS